MTTMPHNMTLSSDDGEVQGQSMMCGWCSLRESLREAMPAAGERSPALPAFLKRQESA